MADLLSPITQPRDLVSPEYAAARMADISRFLSEDAGNLLVLGADGLLYLPQAPEPPPPPEGGATWEEATGTWAEVQGTWADQ